MKFSMVCQYLVSSQIIVSVSDGMWEPQSMVPVARIGKCFCINSDFFRISEQADLLGHVV